MDVTVLYSHIHHKPDNTDNASGGISGKRPVIREKCGFSADSYISYTFTGGIYGYG